MMPEMLANNIVRWALQSVLLASAGALLPVAFRMRHPRTQLTYLHAVLAICMVLPLAEPWQHPVAVRERVAASEESRTYTAPAGQPAAQPVSPQGTLPLVAAPSRHSGRNADVFALPALALIWIFAGGFAVKLAWLVAGLWQTRRRRIAATPLYPIPEAITAACSVTQTDAVFCISADTPGPVMLGWLAPVVLLPETFLSLEDEAQCGIACHELLHARRQDWLVTLLEELAGCLLWFNPAVWLLLAETRLAREEFVDAETVRLTAAREPYIDALLAIAKQRPVFDLAPSPAPLFLRRRHLTQRMHSLLNEVSMSKLRLWFSYGSMTAVFAVSGWFAFASFPLTGSTQYRDVAQATTAPGATGLVPEKAPATVEEAQARIPALAVPANVAPIAGAIDGMAPVPFDPHEPATVPPQVLTTAADRAAALALLERARQNGGLHVAGMAPYRLDISFVANAPGPYTGSGQLSEIWFAPRRWRWTANLGGYSQVQLGLPGSPVSDHHLPTPMPVHLLRNVIFGPVAVNQPRVMRLSSIVWNGQPTSCILMSGVTGPRSATPARLWEENEYCIDNASGLLQVSSSAPGIYAVYGYAANQQFHGRPIADTLTVYAGGAEYIQARLNIADAGTVDPGLFVATPEMVANGAGVMLAGPERFAMDVPSPSAAAAIRPVIVQAEVDVTGHVVDTLLLSASDVSLSAQGLQAVQNNVLEPLGTQRKVFVNVRFLPGRQ